MQVTVTQALTIAIWIALVMSRSLLGGATTPLRFTPMMTGLIVGVVFGNVPEAMVITAAIQLIYMGVFSPGGQMPSEPAIAAAIAVPVALLSDLSPTAAIAVAVPVGLLGSYLYQLRFFINTFFIERLTPKYAKEANTKMLTFTIIGIPILIALVIFTPFMFITLYYGAPVIAKFVAANSATLIFHILTVIGGGLVAIGIAVTVYVIGKRSYIVFFLLAYFMATIFNGFTAAINQAIPALTKAIPALKLTSASNVTMITYAIIGALISFAYVMLRNEAAETMSEKTVSKEGLTTVQSEDDDDY